MNSLIPPVASVVKENWNTVLAFNRDTQKALNMLASYFLGPTGTPTFSSITLTSGLTLSFLTASRLVATNGSKQLSSVANLQSWIAGTANEVDITDDGDGTVTIGLVNPLIVSKGGTGVATLTDHSLLLGSGTDTVTSLGSATNGQLPIGSTDADPVLSTLTGTANRITVTNAAGSITLSTPQDTDTTSVMTLGGLNTTGTVDASAGKVLVTDNNTTEPTNQSDGYIGVAIIGGQPRLYWTVNGDMYYVEGSASAAIATGNPIGLLLTLTYNLE